MKRRRRGITQPPGRASWAFETCAGCGGKRTMLVSTAVDGLDWLPEGMPMCDKCMVQYWTFPTEAASVYFELCLVQEMRHRLGRLEVRRIR